MKSFYDFDYCCRELEEFGRDIRNRINKEMPVALTDMSIMRILLYILPTDMGIRGRAECPFCRMLIEEKLEEMEDQWEKDKAEDLRLWRQKTEDIYGNKETKKCQY